MASPNPHDLEITIISGKHLKNVNWRNGDLKPYAVLYLNPDYRLATHSDESGSTQPVWNERFTLPLSRAVRESVLTVEIFHSRVSEIPKPLVGSLKFPLAQLVDEVDGGSDKPTQSVRSLELLRPSGRQHGKIRVKLAIKERPLPPPPRPPPTIHDYQNTPDYSHYYYSAPPPFPAPARDFGYYTGYYSPHLPPPPQPQPRPSYNQTYSMPAGSGPSAPVDFSPSNNYKPQPLLPPRASAHYLAPPGGSGPSAPVDYTPSDQNVQKQFGGLSLEEEEEVNSNPRDKKPENEFAKREGYIYSNYRHDHDY